MAAFGIPQALLGQGLLTDPRIWFGAVFLVVFAVALRIAGATARCETVASHARARRRRRSCRSTGPTPAPSNI